MLETCTANDDVLGASTGMSASRAEPENSGDADARYSDWVVPRRNVLMLSSFDDVPGNTWTLKAQERTLLRTLTSTWAVCVPSKRLLTLYVSVASAHKHHDTNTFLTNKRSYLERVD